MDQESWHTSFFSRFSSAVSSGSLGTTASGLSLALEAAFFDFGLDDFAADWSLADLGVEVPFVVFGVFVNLMVGLGFLTESVCGVCGVELAPDH
jgi:hypothetical protein